MTTPAATTPAPVNVTAWIGEILAACERRGATITSSRGSSCYGSRCSYGTPSARTWFDTEARAWKSATVVDDVIVHRAEWPLEPIPGRDPWNTRTTGPTVWELAADLGINVNLPAGGFPAGSGILVLTVYEHAATLLANGSAGRGVVLAVGARPTCAALEDQRGTPHLVTNQAGELEIGQFG